MINRMLIGLMIAVACLLFPLFLLLQTLGIRLDFVNELAEENSDAREEKGKSLRPSGRIHFRRV